jgi:hypothetical protein
MDEGLRGEPESVREAIEDYRKGSNPFAQWMDARVILDEGHRIRASELYADYKTWCDDNGHEKPMSQRAFGGALGDLQIIFAGKDGDGKVTRRGARLRLIRGEGFGGADGEGRAPAAVSGTPFLSSFGERRSDDARPDRRLQTNRQIAAGETPARARRRIIVCRAGAFVCAGRRRALRGYRQTDSDGRFRVG